jgi:hypothetical protein
MPNLKKGCKVIRKKIWAAGVEIGRVGRFFTSQTQNLAQKGNLLENAGADWALLEE